MPLCLGETKGPGIWQVHKILMNKRMSPSLLQHYFRSDLTYAKKKKKKKKKA
jgi:hypothetical protein